MTNEERQQKIELYGDAYDLLTKTLQQFPKEMWHSRPSPDDWSIHETVVHITDSEANSYIRCRRCIAEPGSAVMGYDEMGWASALNYADQSTEDALELFKWLRLTSYKLIKALPEQTWSNTIEHSENGAMTLDDWLDVYASHVPDHVAQMHGVFEDWVKM